MASGNIILRAVGIDEIRRDAKRATTAIRGMGRGADKANVKLAGTNRIAKTLSRTMRTLVISAGALAAAFATRAFINIAVQFEQLRIRLKTFSSSQAEATAEWERFIKVAATTQVDLDEIISSMITLRTVGLNPTTEEIRRLADFAAATGLQFEQLTNIIFRGTSSTELFYNAGITARVEGEKLRVTYLGVTEVIAKTSGAIQDYLIGIVAANGYTGAATEVAQGLTGALSNLAGNWKALVEQIGISSGIIDGLSSILAGVADNFADWRLEVAYGQDVFIKWRKNLVDAMAVVSVAAFVAIPALIAAFIRLNLVILANPIVAALAVVVLSIKAFSDDSGSIIAFTVAFFYKAFLDLKTIIVTVIPEAFSILINSIGLAMLALVDTVTRPIVDLVSFLIDLLPDDYVPSWLKSSQAAINNFSQYLVDKQDETTEAIVSSAGRIGQAFVDNRDKADALNLSINETLTAFQSLGTIGSSVLPAHLTQYENIVTVSQQQLDIEAEILAFEKALTMELAEQEAIRKRGAEDRAKNLSSYGGTPFDNRYDIGPDIEREIAEALASEKVLEAERKSAERQAKSAAEAAARARVLYAESISRGIIDGFNDDGIKGAIRSLARSLQNYFADAAAKSLAGAFTGGGAGSSLISGGIGFVKDILGLAKGGLVPGNPSQGDSIPALLTPGELVLNKDQQKTIGSRGGDTVFNQNISISGNVDQRAIQQIQGVTREFVQGNNGLMASSARNGERAETNTF